MITINVKDIVWDLTEDDLAEADLPPISFEILLSKEWILDYLKNDLDTENPILTDLIEDQYPFCLKDIDYELELS